MKNIFYLLMIFSVFVTDILPLQASVSSPLCITDSCTTKVITLGLDQMKCYYKDGRNWYKYETDNEIIIMRLTREKKYGKYYRLDLRILNRSDETYDVIPDSIEGLGINKLNERDTLVTYSAEMYARKMKRQHNWTMALTAASNGINDGMSTANAAYSYNQYDYAYKTSLINQNRILREMQMNEYDNKFKEQLQDRYSNYLKRTTLFPGDIISGYVLIKYKKSKDLEVFIPIKNIKYHVSWDVENM